MQRVPAFLPILASLLLTVSTACNQVGLPVAPPPPAAAENAQTQQAANARTGGGGQGQGQQQGDAAARFQSVNGNVAGIDGQRLAVATATSTVQVALSNQTRYIKMEPVKITDLKQGDMIAVRGISDSFGNLMADTVQLQSAQGLRGQGQAGAAGEGAGDGAGTGNRAQGGNNAAGGNQGNRPQGNNATGGTNPGANTGNQAQGGAQFRAGAGGAGGAGGAAARGRSQRSGITGQIEKIEGTAIIMSEQGGGMQLFIVNSKTSFLRPASGTQADLRAGLVVSVSGQASTDGAINAALITIGDELAAG